MPLSRDPKAKEAQLANLNPITKETAQAMREKGLETRRRRKEALESLKVAAKDLEDAGALTVMRGLVQTYLDQMDYEGAAKLLSQIAEYEQPKLQRQEINQKTTVTELTDEELAEELKKLEDKAR